MTLAAEGWSQVAYNSRLQGHLYSVIRTNALLLPYEPLFTNLSAAEFMQ